MQSITVQVPVKRYVRRFLETRYGTPALLNRTDAVGKYFFELVDRPTQEKDKRYQNKNFPELITIQLTESIFLQRGFVLTPTNVVAFNNFVEDHIEMAMEYFIGGIVAGEKRNGYRIKKVDAYEEFLNKIQLNFDDLPYDTLKKKDMRNNFFRKARTAA